MSNLNSEWILNQNKVQFPNNFNDIKKAKDDQIIDWWRFLPQGSTDREKNLIKSVVYEFNKRFKFRPNTRNIIGNNKYSKPNNYNQNRFKYNNRNS